MNGNDVDDAIDSLLGGLLVDLGSSSDEDEESVKKEESDDDEESSSDSSSSSSSSDDDDEKEGYSADDEKEDAEKEESEAGSADDKEESEEESDKEESDAAAEPAAEDVKDESDTKDESFAAAEEEPVPKKRKRVPVKKIDGGAIKKLKRRAGIQRAGKIFDEQVRTLIDRRLEATVSRAFVNMKLSRGKRTLRKEDVHASLRNLGETMAS